MSETIVRHAAAADAPAVIELIKALADYERLDPPDAAAQSRFAADMASERPRFDAYLAECDGKTAGCTIVFETYSSFLARPKLYIEDIFVLPEYRGRGVGRALFEAMIEEAKQRDCGLMEWTALDWNAPAHQFYGKMGGRILQAWQVYRLEIS